MEFPRECCGLLLGTAQRIAEAVPLENVAADTMRRYEISPSAHLAQVRKCREEGAAEVIGAYHSHPRGKPDPSATDLLEAFEHFWFVIAGPVSERESLEVRGYRLVDGAFRETRLVPEGEAPS
jgi:proteasome lid subunit RPN8/RPN11